MADPDLRLDVRRRRMERIDALPQDVRVLVHEFGWTVVGQFWDAGVRKPSLIRHLIETVLTGAHEVQSRRLKLHGQSDAGEVLAQCMGDLGIMANAEALAKRLRFRGRIVAPVTPTPAMVQASMDALARRQQPDRVWPREQKHRLRLADALAAAAKEYMPLEE